jgi:plasmid stabilization system protein ParE
MMQVIFTPAARAEVLDAQDWYEGQQQGLGSRFRRELDTAVLRMIENPYQFPIVFQDVHRARLKKFPYASFSELKRTQRWCLRAFTVAVIRKGGSSEFDRCIRDMRNRGLPSPLARNLRLIRAKFRNHPLTPFPGILCKILPFRIKILRAALLNLRKSLETNNLTL